MEIQAPFDRVLPRNFVGSFLGLCGDSSFRKNEKKNVVPVFWGPKMETTSKYDLDPVGPPENGKRVKQ